MGLAAPRKRVKISHDPNNTKWAQSTGGFGHKIMTSQGWTPGSYLGARNASHADTFTAASASHIRVTLKDDTLGLGARPPKMGNENVAALDAFQGLLGRLNGKSDVELEKEQRKRDDSRLALYARNKWQTVTFISGGYLVQEKPDDAAKNNLKITQETSDETSDAEDVPAKSSNDTADIKVTETEDSESFKHVNDGAKPPSEKNVGGKEEKDTKDKNKKRKEKEAKKEKRDRKAKKEKKEKKEKKREKEEKEKKDSSKKRRRTDMEGDNSDSSISNGPDNKAPQLKATTLQRQTPQWRHSLRGRHIQQKKMAVMDDRSLGEIFMIKA